MTYRRIIIAVFDLLVVLGVLGVLTPTVHAQTLWLNVRFWPSSVTPNDQIRIEANVTSTTAIGNVTIFYRIGPSGLQLSSKSDYNRTLMQHVFQKAESGLWDYQFGKQIANTTVYFFVEAKNVLGEVSSWPVNAPEAPRPMELPVQNPGASYLESVYITINSLELGAKLQRANITVSLYGFIPNFPEEYWLQTTVLSGGYIAFNVQLVEQGPRFYYSGQASGWVVLSNTHMEAAPFDTYDLSLTITLPYRIMNVTRLEGSVPIWFATNDLWNSWNIPWPAPIWSRDSNSTHLTIQATLGRNGVTGFVPTYPPLVLLFTSFGILGLVPLVARYYVGKQLDVYLNAIILAASAELSQNIFVVGGALQQNFFTYFFAYVLAFSVVLMAISGLSPAIEKLPKQIPPESYATVAMSMGIAYSIYNWSIPLTAKILLVLLIISGVVILGVIAALRTLGAHRPYVRVKKSLKQFMQEHVNCDRELEKKGNRQ